MTREYMLNALRKRHYRVKFLSTGEVELSWLADIHAPKLLQCTFRSLTSAYKQVRIWSQLAKQKSGDLSF